MFVGHYAPAFALKAVRNSPGLATGFIAVQLVDIGFFSLAWGGIETWTARPDLPGFSKVEFNFMPYTHSLLASAVWALAAGFVVAMLCPAGRRVVGGLVTVALVLSHWFVDLPVHRPDLTLASDADAKLGFGLWNEPVLAAPLEIGLLLAAFAIYMRVTVARNLAGRILPWAVIGILVGAQLLNWSMPPAASIAEFSAMGLAAYAVAALLALLLDRTREQAPMPRRG